jgi:hypothetical protein
LAKKDGTPAKKWELVKTTLLDIDTHQLHYVHVPADHIVIDFDLKDEKGEKSLELNLQAASEWPKTYAELSRSGSGVHLHYKWTGDVKDLASVYSPGIEVKVYSGNSALRRQLTKCNNIPVAELNSGLPLKDRKLQNTASMRSERGLRALIERNLKKEIHPGTKSSIDFIKKILDEAYESGIPYDVTDMRSRIIAFANNSSNQPVKALRVVREMKFVSEKAAGASDDPDAKQIAFFDIEVYPNLFLICWKYAGSDQVISMVNPKAEEVESLLAMALVGFNNRRYDNHILYAAYMGYDTARLAALSNKLVSNQGADTLTGTGGEDILIGGNDRDSLFGNKGRDVALGDQGQIDLSNLATWALAGKANLPPSAPTSSSAWSTSSPPGSPWASSTSSAACLCSSFLQPSWQ